MPFRTTIAGSLPKPAWLAEPERIFPTWRLDGPELAEAQRDATRIAVCEQLRAGIDTVTDGEQTRKHFVHGFAERLGGVDPAKRQKRGIRADRYEAVCPTVTGEVRRVAPVHVEEVRFARTLTGGTLKITIPGPMTLVDTVVDEAYGSRRELAFAFARAIRAEIVDLIAAGVDVVQLDEPAFNVYFDEVAAWGIDALDTALGAATCTTAVHVCYGYGIPANVAWKANLGERWDQYAHVLPLLARSSVDQISIELAGSHVPPETLELAGDKTLAIGVIDVATERIETPDDVANTIALARRYLPDERIVCSTNCGMAPMAREVAYAKLRSLAEGALLASVGL
ncbi:5-methyltetrahydropteroyltriglutamate--homocysteine methyltransferase [Vulcanimicrobium alpinum]|uniref:5-methyltetrahydropteroyltriglutamate--homocysteine methyltransferase n=1 Tax=Vulcanimicrobium alpinum TaxID=3016050 RepID=A0AAN1XZM4_UNVUL|nr:methionine synthase [Vulcanimicrobium alpinum]BDE07701.1 5-methyltetrahydropteroyltriglutamate--homocysteine methyltransferase [Vulcanimicrobium alpinum]